MTLSGLDETEYAWAHTLDVGVTMHDRQIQIINLLAREELIAPWGLPAGPLDTDLQEFEANYGMRIGGDLVDWFSLVNGAGCGGQYFLGLPRAGKKPRYCSLEERLLPEWIDRKWLPIAADGCGNHYLVDLTVATPERTVVFFNETIIDACEKQYAVASNIWIFSELFALYEINFDPHVDQWPFDRDLTLKRDPAMAKVRSAPLPWQLDGSPI